jgi:hypothetical protein
MIGCHAAICAAESRPVVLAPFDSLRPLGAGVEHGHAERRSAQDTGYARAQVMHDARIMRRDSVVVNGESG